MSIATLQDIITKIRRLTGSGNSNQITDSQIIDYINSYYLFDLPDDLRVLQLKDVYTFNTIQGLDTYPFDYDNWSTVEAPAYCSKSQMTLFQDKASFYGYNINPQQLETFATGDGTAGPYSGTTSANPILASVNNNPEVVTAIPNTQVFPAGYPPTFSDANISRIQNILISANTATSSFHVSDDGAGNLIGDVLPGGTINYNTGVITNLIFTGNVPSGNEINIQYAQQVQGQPFHILFFQQQFVVRPVPDQAYTIEITAYREPSKALLGTTSSTAPTLSGRPELQEWWETLAFGASKKIYQDRLDLDGVQIMDAFLKEAISANQTRTYGQLGKRQSNTLFRDETISQNNQSWWGQW